MATGIPKKKKSSKNSIIELKYDIKINKEDLLQSHYSCYTDIWRTQDNAFNKLFYGDNLDVLLYLLNNGYKNTVNLIYIDPPYSTSSVFVNREQKVAYHDTLDGYDYIEFLRRRFLIMYDLLSQTGSFYIHLDERMVFPIKIILDEIFGVYNFRAFITRKKCSPKNSTRTTYGDISDYILFYSKTKNYVWNKPSVAWSNEKIIEQYPCIDEATGRRYKKVPIHAPGVRNGDTGKPWRGMMPPLGKHWQYTPEKLDMLDAAGEIAWSKNGNPRRKVFFDGKQGIPMQNIWLDYQDFVNQSQISTGYPTEKNIEMLKTIISASSNKGDIVLDCFAGSGTTLSAAELLERRWIGVDNSQESIQTIISRLLFEEQSYGDYVIKRRSNSCSRKLTKCAFQIFAIEKDKNNIISYCNLNK